MVVVIKQWVPIDGLTHIKTSYKMYTDAALTNIIAEVSESSDFLTLWDNGIDVPLGETYYVSYQRILQDTNLDTIYLDWTPPKPYTGIDLGNPFLIEELPVIDIPSIYVDRNEILDTSKNKFTIKTSKYRGNTEGIHTVIWIIASLSGDVIFAELTSANIYEIEIDKELYPDILNMDNVVFYVIHRTASGLESPVGKKVVTLSWVNYKITSNLDRVIPGVDFKLVLEKVNPQLDLDVTYLELRSVGVENELLYNTMVVPTLNGVVNIPGFFLEPGNTYKLVITSSKLSNVNAIRSFQLKVLPLDIEKNKDLSYRYNKKLTYVRADPYIKIPNGTVTEELYNGKIYSPVIGSDKLHEVIYKRETKKLEDTGITLPNITITNINNILIKVFNRDRLLIDTIVDGKATFFIYRINPYEGRLDLLLSAPRNDESVSLGKTNSLYVLDNTNIIYVPVTGEAIKKLNLTTGEISIVSLIPDGPINSLGLLPISNNRILLVGNDKMLAKCYHTDTNSYTEAAVILSIFRNRGYMAIPLINGDGMLVRTSKELDTDTTTNSVLYFDHSKNKLDLLAPIYSGIAYPKSIIKLITGEVVLTEHINNANNIFFFN